MAQEDKKDGKPVSQIDKTSGKVIAIHRSIDDAVSALGLSTRSHVSECCVGKRKSAHSYYWAYAPVINNNMK